MASFAATVGAWCDKVPMALEIIFKEAAQELVSQLNELVPTMRYFDEQLVANSRPHAAWWSEVSMVREHFHRQEEVLANLTSEFLGNAASILPRDAWLELDGITRRVLRAD